MVSKKQTFSRKNLNFLIFLLFKGLLILMVMLSPLIAYIVLPKSLHSNEVKGSINTTFGRSFLPKNELSSYLDDSNSRVFVLDDNNVFNDKIEPENLFYILNDSSVIEMASFMQSLLDVRQSDLSKDIESSNFAHSNTSFVVYESSGSAEDDVLKMTQKLPSSSAWEGGGTGAEMPLLPSLNVGGNGSGIMDKDPKKDENKLTDVQPVKDQSMMPQPLIKSTAKDEKQMSMDLPTLPVLPNTDMGQNISDMMAKDTKKDENKLTDVQSVKDQSMMLQLQAKSTEKDGKQIGEEVPALPVFPNLDIGKNASDTLPKNPESDGSKLKGSGSSDPLMSKLLSKPQNLMAEPLQQKVAQVEPMQKDFKAKPPAMKKSTSELDLLEPNSEPGKSVVDLYITQSVNRLHTLVPQSILASHNPDNNYLRDIMQKKDYIDLVFYNIKNENVVVLSSLIDILQDTEVTNINSETPLIYAVKLGKINSVKVLLGKGANINAKNSKDLTPLDLAKENGSKAILEIIKQNI